MNWIYYLPFVIQAVVISFDEFFFHVKRGLPRWERIGHPIDTFSVVLCIAYVLIFTYSTGLLMGYLALAVLSCLLVTKDEFVHKEHCPASEHWLHALLFVNHPLVLISLGWMWGRGVFYRPFLYFQLVFVTLFCLYQLIYWNLVWKDDQ